MVWHLVTHLGNNLKKLKMMKTENSIQKTAKFAGWAYFLIIVTALLSITLGSFMPMDDVSVAETIENIKENQSLYRINYVYEILMYSGVILLSVALFQILKGINKAFALTALLFRFGEAIMGMIMVIGSIIILYLVNSDFSTESNQKTITIIFELKDALMSMLMVFIGLGSIINFYLFYKSNFIPRWLSVFGITAFSFVLIESLVLHVKPMHAWMFPGMLAIVFEIVVGLWLMIKGIKTNS